MKKRAAFFTKILFCLLLVGIAAFCSASVYETWAASGTAEQWLSQELSFAASQKYEAPYYDVNLDVVFTNSRTGTTFTVPGFWDGGAVWKVRFALTELGEWRYRTVCNNSSDTGLHDRQGTISCIAYTGDLPIYQRGFVSVQDRTRYFTYADGTPFFYLGDTHWHMLLEDLESRFPAILEERAKQGFTVIQSEPLGIWTNAYGNDGLTGVFEEFSEELLLQFQELDKYFEMIASYGFVHANSQFSYPTSLGAYMNKISDENLERLCRYWVARYSSYPVMWTTAQECDNDYYYERGDQSDFSAETNPWKKVAEWIHRYDPYKSPLTAHQEHSSYTTASNSAFGEVEGHNWWASQFGFDIDSQFPFYQASNYWYYGKEKVIVNYEGRYDHFWTTTAGARAQGWTSYLNGMYGYGYGSAKIWSAYDAPGIWGGAVPDKVSDSYETLYRSDMDITWQESLQLPAAAQLGYMKAFLEEQQWWLLKPQFESASRFLPAGSDVYYSVARKDYDRIVAYFYSRTRSTGTFKKLNETYYKVSWFNPCTGEYLSDPELRFAKAGILELGEKPDSYDWVALLEKAENALEFQTGANCYIDGSYLYIPGARTGEQLFDLIKDTSALSLSGTKGDFVGTGGTLTCHDTDYTIVVKGDVNGDGRITSSDYIRIKKYIGGTAQLTGASFLAADIDSNNTIKSADYIKIKAHFAGRIDIWKI